MGGTKWILNDKVVEQRGVRCYIPRSTVGLSTWSPHQSPRSTHVLVPMDAAKFYLPSQIQPQQQFRILGQCATTTTSRRNRRSTVRLCRTRLHWPSFSSRAAKFIQLLVVLAISIRSTTAEGTWFVANWFNMARIVWAFFCCCPTSPVLSTRLSRLV